MASTVAQPNDDRPKVMGRPPVLRCHEEALGNLLAAADDTAGFLFRTARAHLCAAAALEKAVSGLPPSVIAAAQLSINIHFTTAEKLRSQAIALAKQRKELSKNVWANHSRRITKRVAA